MEELDKQLGLLPMKGSRDQDSYFDYDFTRTKESIRLSADLIDKKII